MMDISTFIRSTGFLFLIFISQMQMTLSQDMDFDGERLNTTAAVNRLDGIPQPLFDTIPKPIDAIPKPLDVMPPALDLTPKPVVTKPRVIWEDWSSWSECSKTCGSGVEIQTRRCRIPHHEQTDEMDTDEYRSCNQAHRQYRACHSKTCAIGIPEFRRSLCSQFNNRTFGGKKYSWNPFDRGHPCELSCRAIGHRFFMRPPSPAFDGIDCSYTKNDDGKHICVKGECQKVGCDNVVGSDNRPDVCGKCGGDGSTCDFVNGVFVEQLPSNNFHRVVEIPSGATKINITELSNTRTYLALRSTRGLKQFYFNGNMDRGVPDQPRTYTAAGTSFIYKRPYNSEKGESIVADGPTNEDIEIWIWSQSENPGIKYEFIVQKETSPQADLVTRSRQNTLERSSIYTSPSSSLRRRQQWSQRPRILPRPVPYDAYISSRNPRYRGRYAHHPRAYPNAGGLDTQRLTGTFVTRTNLRTEGNSQGTTRSIVAPTRKPLQKHIKRRVEAINVTVSTPTSGQVSSTSTESGSSTWSGALWVRAGYGPCSRSCGGGLKNPVIQCKSSVEKDAEVLPDLECPGERPKLKPKKCNIVACSARYIVGEWSDCSSTCGVGRRTRMVSCRQRLPGATYPTAVSRKKCKHQVKPANFERCVLKPCAARWKPVGGWSECSVKCGIGIQTHDAICVDIKGETLDNSECPVLKHDPFRKRCDAGPCVTNWFITEWSQCSADCDSGVQRRNVVCMNTASPGGECSSDDKPADSQKCRQPACQVKYHWFANNWGACSVECGKGYQSRMVVCLQETPNGDLTVSSDQSLCELSEKPAIQQPCATHECEGIWHFTDWTKCSSTCGGGSKRREVHCLNPSGERSETCEQATKPDSTETCNLQKCPPPRDSSCQDRLPRCRMVLQAKLCSYKYYRTKCCATCSSKANIIRGKRQAKRRRRHERLQLIYPDPIETS